MHCRGRNRCYERGLIPYGGYPPYYPSINPYYANAYLYQAYLNSNLYDTYYPSLYYPSSYYPYYY